LAEALESRAFGVTQKREPLTVLKMKQSDYLVAATVFLTLLIGIYIQITISLPNFDNNVTMPPIWQFWD
jgi:energy-coupling factor transporter transmembrane protein EcfT